MQNLVNEKHTITKTNDDHLLIEGDLSLLAGIKKRIIKNEQEELITSILEKNRNENSSKFFINKQCAFYNNLHLIDENMSVLGDIEVNILSDNLDEVIQWFC